MMQGDHALWDQIVRKEAETKKRFEYLTGQTQAKKFYNGQGEKNVDHTLVTFQRMKQMSKGETAKDYKELQT